ncbi:hypothetical protein FISHEDRAFT_70998 [Fistulina hepatica ATCC 64428]|uniref:Uncharacterized protein n=1 Tax=Fistulina hepatica ATCC 64428 TaxID=1128425 RepID=A0A0D7AHM7_9AGAR|nr:hypothetical protein FISHEDRAFT_70998 [Fistulina hepatica ATCC 64428]
MALNDTAPSADAVVHTADPPSVSPAPPPDNSAPATATDSQPLSDLPDGDERGSEGVNAQAKSTPTTVPNGTIGTASRPPSAPSSAATAHPKRFSAVNVGKKFLEKTSNNSASSFTPSTTVKSTNVGAVSRSQVQTTASHSRLVTAKLTALPQSTTGQGWSRPPSNANTPLPQTPIATTPSGGPPALPHPGKIIHPQPRGAVPRDSRNVSPVKQAAWGKVQTSGSTPPFTANDFPTAAEVAQAEARSISRERESTRESTAAAEAIKQEADTFRGIHLDPNAHHWDEMEEDDDNFLGDVIDFGDGRQYKLDTPVVDEPAAAESAPVSKAERFVDDFDRSWPRSHSGSADSPALSSRGDVPLPPMSTSSSSQQGNYNASRVLFNERSNRLEPYNHNQASGPRKDVLHRDRDPLPHRDGPPTRPRGFSGTSSGSQSGNTPWHGYDRDRGGHYDRGQGVGRGAMVSPRMPFSPFGPPNRESDDRVRRGDMGPPPPPLPFSGRKPSFNDRDRRPSFAKSDHNRRPSFNSRDRPLPPHLSPSYNAPPLPVPQRRMSSRESQRETPHSAYSQHFPQASPVLSHTSAQFASPEISSALPTADLDEVRKDVMHDAAARAKQRRQLEEEEREKEKERARKKAAELEQRINAAKEVEQAKLAASQAPVVTEVSELYMFSSPCAKNSLQQEEVNAVIQDAVDAVKTSASPTSDITQPPSTLQKSEQPFSPQQSTDGGSRPPTLRRRNSATYAPSTPATEAESWRRSNPLQPSQEPRRPALPSFVPAPAAVARPAPSLTASQTPAFLHSPAPVQTPLSGTDVTVEEVDFSEMGKLVGAPSAAASTKEPVQPNSPRRIMSRPVASDFFDQPPLSKSDVSPAWRRPQVVEPSPKQEVVDEVHDNPRESVDSAQHTVYNEKDVHLELRLNHSSISHQPHPFQKPGRSQVNNEAAIHALDDAMSRIRGAIDGMQSDTSLQQAHQRRRSNESAANIRTSPISHGRKPVVKDRWIPPAMRPRPESQPEETFDVTAPEPPRSPPPAWHDLIVNMPKLSRLIDPVPRKQLTNASKPAFPIRWDILSFDPPVEGMSRRDFTVNEILFRKPQGFKGRVRYRVSLPKVYLRPPFTGPRVNLPMSKSLTTTGAFGRPSGEDGMSTWRKSPIPGSATPQVVDTELNTVSVSPPPSASPHDGMGAKSPSVKADASLTLQKSKAHPKMPDGSAVAFYRGACSEQGEAGVVSFTVNSELEEKQPSLSITPPTSAQPSITVTSPKTNGLTPKSRELPSQYVVNTSKSGFSDPAHSPLVYSSTKPEGKSSEHVVRRFFLSDDDVLMGEQTDSGSVTPPTQHSTWGKSPLSLPTLESPSRAPDPEHLKAVWSQTSNTEAGLQPVNSLENIGDDLPALPFILQDMKSEDGETPPPSLPSAPSRMSQHDVARAFQTVPTSNGAPPPRPPTSPPTTNVPMSRSHSYQSGPSPAMRPPYVYGQPPTQPMMAGAQTVMYPMPANGTPIYGRMWPIGAPTQNPGVMRPPYPSQMMYPAPGTAMYQQPNVPSPIPNRQQNGPPPPPMPAPMPPRGSSLLMSPGPYPASPVMMQAHPAMQQMTMPPTQGNYMALMAPGRGQMRSDNSQRPHMPPGAQPPMRNGYVSSSAPITRPTW